MMPERVLVVGTTCAGKSTLARRLAEIIDCPFVELDELWGPEWSPSPRPEFLALAAEATEASRWVAEGNYRAGRGVLWPKATTVVWLNYSFFTVMSRAMRRTAKHVVAGQVAAHDRRASPRQSFLSKRSKVCWAATSFRRRRREFTALRSSGAFPHLFWIELRRASDAEAFLRSLGTTA